MGRESSLPIERLPRQASGTAGGVAHILAGLDARVLVSFGGSHRQCAYQHSFRRVRFFTEFQTSRWMLRCEGGTGRDGPTCRRRRDSSHCRRELRIRGCCSIRSEKDASAASLLGRCRCSAITESVVHGLEYARPVCVLGRYMTRCELASNFRPGNAG